MTRIVRSLRVQLALFGFVAIYLPVLALGIGLLVTEDVATTTETPQGEIVEIETSGASPAFTWLAVGFFPVAAAIAWWWSGRAVAPIDRVRAVAEEIEETALDRRIGLSDAPTEVMALAASFDAMLDRLERSAETQRQLVEEASHELRTPLAVLATNADVLLAHPEPTLDVYREGLQRSRDVARRMQATIDELLVDARGRARTVTRAPVDLVAVVGGVVADARVLAASQGVELAVSGPPSARCSLDEPTVRRAIANLVDNAVRYSPAGAEVDVAVRVADTTAAVVVTDQGPGIPPDEQGHIFERFWRGRPDTQGSGLGLPIANQVALAHGGTLEVTSPTPTGRGTTFTLTLRR